VGSRKGYEIYVKKRASMTHATRNELYSDGGRTGTNPLFANSQAFELKTTA
jgi:hypothetical protein